MRLIGLTGPARSGKSTVAEMLDAQGFSVYHFADPLKDGLATMLAPLGDRIIWHLEDEAFKEQQIPGLGVSPRYLWQTLGTEWGRERVRSDLWILIAAAKLARDSALDFMPAACFADVRFDNEARWIKAQGGEIWRIVRPGTENQVRAHSSEAGIPADLIDHGVVNDGDLAALAARVERLLQ